MIGENTGRAFSRTLEGILSRFSDSLLFEATIEASAIDKVSREHLRIDLGGYDENGS